MAVEAEAAGLPGPMLHAIREAAEWVELAGGLDWGWWCAAPRAPLLLELSSPSMGPHLNRRIADSSPCRHPRLLPACYVAFWRLLSRSGVG